MIASILHFVLNALSFLLPAIGFVVAIRVARRRRNFGFLIIALFFVMSFVLTVQRRVHDARYNRVMEQAFSASMPDDVRIPGKMRSVYLPILPAVLVAGVWLAGRDEKENLEQNNELQPTS